MPGNHGVIRPPGQGPTSHGASLAVIPEESCYHQFNPRIMDSETSDYATHTTRQGSNTGRF